MVLAIIEIDQIPASLSPLLEYFSYVFKVEKGGHQASHWSRA